MRLNEGSDIKMKIGIITWFSYNNYGTKLQAIALQKYLKNLGHNVKMINFIPPESIENSFGKKERKSIFKKISGKYHNIWEKIAYQKFRDDFILKKDKLEKIIFKSCELTTKICSDEEYIAICNEFDILVCGSDQIWNPNWYHKYYFADFEKIQTERISYAPSFGVELIPDDIRNELKMSLLKFQKITVRENTGGKIVQMILGNNPEVVVDPTLLLSADEWNEFLDIGEDVNKPYAVCYLLGKNMNHWHAITRYVKDKKLKLRIIPQYGRDYFRNGEILSDAGVEDFVKNISKAEVVFTDSFHATVFSVLYQRQFYTFERFKEDDNSSQNSRVKDFLERLDLSYNLIPFNSKKISVQEVPDYKNVKKTLFYEIDKSKRVLYQALGEESNEL